MVCCRLCSASRALVLLLSVSFCPSTDGSKDRARFLFLAGLRVEVGEVVVTCASCPCSLLGVVISLMAWVLSVGAGVLWLRLLGGLLVLVELTVSVTVGLFGVFSSEEISIAPDSLPFVSCS